MTYTDAQIEAVARVIANAAADWTHNECGDDNHALGHSNWRAYTGYARAALAAAEEAGEWEYAWVHEDGRVGELGGTPTARWFSERSRAPEPGWFRARRRPAGPWLPVEGSEG